MESQASSKPSYERGEEGSFSLLVSITAGFSLLWTCFFLVLLYDPFIGSQTSEPEGWGWALLPALACIGFVASCIIVSQLCDFFASESGHRFLRGFIIVLPIVPSIIIFLQSANNVIVPLPFLVVAWVGIGFSFGCLLQLWAELLASFTKGFTSKILCSTVGMGGLCFFIVSNLPLAITILFVSVAAPISLGLLYMLEKEVPPAHFVSREESLARHRLSWPIDALNTFYCIVFGLAIQMLPISEPSIFLTIGVSVALVAGAMLMLPFLGKKTSRMMHGEVQRFLFPFLIVGLLPMPFVEGALRVACMLVLLACFVCLIITCLDSLTCLVKCYDVAPLYLVGRGVSPILVGVSIGYVAGAVVSQSHLFDSSLLPLFSLGMVIVLSLIVTIIRFDKDYLAEEEADLAKAALEQSSQKGAGYFKTRCAIVSKNAGLSSRETEVFLLLAKGHGNSYIQDKLYISLHTVKAHVYNIYKKMGISSREELLQLIEDAPIPEDDAG